MVYCPHTFNPQDHELDVPLLNNQITQCGTCDGFIQVCTKCDELNRLAARYCTQCGNELETTPYSFDETFLVKGVSRRVNKSLEFRLDKTLRSKVEDKPLLWISNDEGVFVFTHNPDARVYQLNVYYVSNYKFQQGCGQHLTREKSLPRFSEWTQEPLVSRQGLFISTTRELHYFPAHGYDEKYEHRIWKANSDETILSIALNHSGHPTILIKGNNNQIFILEGNAQSGRWGKDEKRHLLDDSKGNTTAYLTTTEGLENDYWIYNGITLIHYNIATRDIVAKLELKMGTTMPLSLEEKLKRGYFTPFIIRDKQNILRNVIPVKSATDDHARVGLLQNGSASPRIVNPKQPHKWVKPYPTGEGFSLGLVGVIKGFVGHQEKWEIEKKTTISSPPLMLRNWFATLITFNAVPREGTKNIPAVIFKPASQNKGNYTPEKDKSWTSSIEQKGLPLSGLPLLYANGYMYIALQNRNITTIYQIQISG